uniref:DUF4472 domain-containing protein n=1 Tax=Eptatretus burgeri TaxID=7764 RepID=A0A8C4QZ37_EPTBU
MNPRITQKCCTMHEQMLKLNTENDPLRRKAGSVEPQCKFEIHLQDPRLLQIHKALFKMQVQEKLQKKEHETETFELESKVLVLENELVRVELQRDSDYQELVLANAWLSALEKDYQELSTQHLALKNKEHEPCKPSATEQEMKTVVADVSCTCFKRLLIEIHCKIFLFFE